MVSRYTLMSSAFICLPIIFSQSIFFLAFMTRRDDNHDNIHFNFHAGRQRQGVAFSYVIVSKLLISVVDFFFLLYSSGFFFRGVPTYGAFRWDPVAILRLAAETHSIGCCSELQDRTRTLG
jgi:hypothetical protein